MYRNQSRHSGNGFSGRPTNSNQNAFRAPFRGRNSFRPQSKSKGIRGGVFSDISRFVNRAVPLEKAEPFKPENSFNDFPVDARLKANIVTKGYTEPTPIQDKAIPHVFKGADVFGIANTGTGKTAAFLIPLIQKVLMNSRERVMILAPTRELAIQIDDEFKHLARGLRLFSVSCVGGAPIGRQIAELRRGSHFIVGTPGRVKDLVQRKQIQLADFATIVLDEADRMLDMGFINDMRFVMSQMKAERQTLFFSATLSKEIEALIGDFLKNPVRISVKTQDTSKNVDQDVIRVTPDKIKIDVLHDLLIQPDFNKVLIFGRTKHGVEKLFKALLARGFKAESIHGDKNHSKRQRALNAFRADHIQILVATDVAARGLDISGVSHVINYELPATYEDYVHRIGRTGRAGRAGRALTFID